MHLQPMNEWKIFPVLPRLAIFRSARGVVLLSIKLVIRISTPPNAMIHEHNSQNYFHTIFLYHILISNDKFNAKSQNNVFRHPKPKYKETGRRGTWWLSHWSIVSSSFVQFLL